MLPTQLELFPYENMKIIFLMNPTKYCCIPITWYLQIILFEYLYAMIPLQMLWLIFSTLQFYIPINLLVRLRVLQFLCGSCVITCNSEIKTTNKQHVCYHKLIWTPDEFWISIIKNDNYLGCRCFSWWNVPDSRQF